MNNTENLNQFNLNIFNPLNEYFKKYDQLARQKGEYIEQNNLNTNIEITPEEIKKSFYSEGNIINDDKWTDYLRLFAKNLTFYDRFLCHYTDLDLIKTNFNEAFNEFKQIVENPPEGKNITTNTFGYGWLTGEYRYNLQEVLNIYNKKMENINSDLEFKENKFKDNQTFTKDELNNVFYKLANDNFVLPYATTANSSIVKLLYDIYNELDEKNIDVRYFNRYFEFLPTDVDTSNVPIVWRLNIKKDKDGYPFIYHLFTQEDAKIIEKTFNDCTSQILKNLIKKYNKNDKYLLEGFKKENPLYIEKEEVEEKEDNEEQKQAERQEAERQEAERQKAERQDTQKPLFGDQIQAQKVHKISDFINIIKQEAEKLEAERQKQEKERQEAKRQKQEEEERQNKILEEAYAEVEEKERQEAERQKQEEERQEAKRQAENKEIRNEIVKIGRESKKDNKKIKEYIYPEALLNVSKYVPQPRNSILTLEDAVKLGYINKLGPLGALLLLSQGMLTVENQYFTGGALQEGNNIGYHTYNQKINNIFDTLISKVDRNKFDKKVKKKIKRKLDNIKEKEENVYKLLLKIGSKIEESSQKEEINWDKLITNKKFNNLMKKLKEKRKEFERNDNLEIIDLYKNLLN